MSALRLDSPIQFVKGVGPNRAAAFAQIGLHTVGDLLEYIPFRYEQSDGEVEIADLRPGVTATIRGEVTRVRYKHPGLDATVIDSSGQTCALRWFQDRSSGHGIYVGAQVIATGEVREYNSRLELIQPSIRVYAPGTEIPRTHAAPRPLPVYRATAQLASHVVQKVVQSAIATAPEGVLDPLPPDLLAQHKLPDRLTALLHVHAPPNAEALAVARRRLAYEELFVLELALAIRRHRSRALATGQKLCSSVEIDRRIRNRFPFELTAGQNRVIEQIMGDLASGHTMRRLLQGDVGSGKTVVALYAMLVAIANKRQAALMAPTEILAQQHYRRVQQYLADSRVRHVLLSGTLPRSHRTQVLAEIAAGEYDLVVGTQALIQRDVEFARLGLVVVDEQHRFGVMQRAAFRTRGPQSHYLAMTATPIPRTLAMTVFGDLDVSVIRESPPGRGKITTTLTPAGGAEKLYRDMAERLRGGEQAYVVCPLIGRDDAAEPDGPPKGTQPAPHQAATILYRKLCDGAWRGLQVALLHGELPPVEKDRALRDFAAGKIQALVSTTVVEVGVDVANATIMAIESAERFGLAQLHQLRGRVGRGRRDATCHLIVRTRSPNAAARLSVLLETTDGFRIAEADLRQRGPGEFLGTRQHGLPELKFSDLVTDLAILEIARQDALSVIQRDPGLKAPEHQHLRAAMRKLWAEKLKLIDAA